jgi:hypothetical protein
MNYPIQKSHDKNPMKLSKKASKKIACCAAVEKSKPRKALRKPGTSVPF